MKTAKLKNGLICVSVQKKLNRIKMINELKNNQTFLDLLADFKLAKFSNMTIANNQIENENELASYWLNQDLQQLYKHI